MSCISPQYQLKTEHPGEYFLITVNLVNRDKMFM